MTFGQNMHEIGWFEDFARPYVVLNDLNENRVKYYWQFRNSLCNIWRRNCDIYTLCITNNYIIPYRILIVSLAVYGHVILNRKFHFPRVQWNTLCECNCTLCVFDKSHPSKCFPYESISLFGTYYIKQFGERWNVPFNSAVAS
jgi:hypothetical protein